MPEFSLPAEDAAELADFLRFLSEWVAASRSEIGSSLARFMGHHPYGVEMLRHDLVRFWSMLGDDAHGGAVF